MAAATITIPVSASMKAFAEEQAVKGNHPTAGDYIRQLIEGEQGSVESRLIAALQAEPVEITDEEWQHGDIFGIALERVQQRQTSR